MLKVYLASSVVSYILNYFEQTWRLQSE